MATVMLMHWPEVTKEQYEQVRQSVKWEENPPDGAKFHTAWMAGDGFHVLDLWESQGHFERFLQNRLSSAVAAAGIGGQPKVEFAETLSIFAPNV
jgi:hypothetical protein